jgi:subfamily B ATP-binding cassette protein MsbA
LTIEPGQTVALVGASGGGKSTLINLLPRFYDYAQGEILIDGVDLKHFRLNNLRKQIAMVTQNVTLFNASVADNIAYGALQGAGRSRIQQAATDAYAMTFIEKMLQGLDTEIGENGVKLSGGQRQRLALARALLKDAPILILDEATSALDTESERYIQAALHRVMQGRTTLVVAHRLSTIEGADVILVMDKGQIVEQGSHEELLKQDGAYAKLYNMQFKDVDVDVAQSE